MCATRTNIRIVRARQGRKARTSNFVNYPILTKFFRGNVALFCKCCENVNLKFGAKGREKSVDFRVKRSLQRLLNTVGWVYWSITVYRSLNITHIHPSAWHSRRSDPTTLGAIRTPTSHTDNLADYCINLYVAVELNARSMPTAIMS